MGKSLTELEAGLVSVIIDRDHGLTYESHGIATKLFYFPLMLLLNMLPKSIAQKVFLILSSYKSDVQKVFDSVTTHKALEVMYTFPERHKNKKTEPSDFFWETFLNNAKSIRNRLNLVERELDRIIQEVVRKKKVVNILSLGGGSSRAVIETVHRLSVPCNVKLIDISRDAISYSKELASMFNLDGDKMSYYRDYAQNLEKYCIHFNPDVVEMVGLIDYYPQPQAIDLVAKIYKILAPGGWLITSNIRPNFESPFVTKGINWQGMIYRNPKEFAAILLRGGFIADDVRIVYEPLKIHGIGICQKLV